MYNAYSLLYHIIKPTVSRLMRLTSPNLNYIIGTGAILLYLAIYVMVIPSTDPTAVAVLCNVSAHLCE